MLHIKLGKNRKTRSDLQEMKIEGRFHKRLEGFEPIPHIKWIEALEKGAETLGIDAFGWKFSTSDYYGTNSEMHGSFDFMFPDDPDVLPGKQSSRSIGWSISNGGRHRPRLFIGGRFGLEGEGGYAADRVDMRVHTDPLESFVAEFFQMLKSRCEIIDNKVDNMLSSPLWHSDRTLILVEMARQEIMPWSRLKVCDTFCTENEIRKEENLWWDLIRGAGRAIAKNTPLKQLTQLGEAWKLSWEWHEWKEEQEISEEGVES